MKAAVVHDFRKPLSIDDIAKPEPGLGEVIVKGRDVRGLSHRHPRRAWGLADQADPTVRARA
jgi:Zn-dependent alcohol dehydrogenase